MTNDEVLTGNKLRHSKVKTWGRLDALAGKPIEAYYQTNLKRHTEQLRASYEIGWRDAQCEADQAYYDKGKQAFKMGAPSSAALQIERSRLKLKWLQE